jgi:probable HAF family extracellular repeat protein
MPTDAVASGYGYATSINDAGQIVGYASTVTGVYGPFTAYMVKSPGNAMYIPGATPKASRADAINNSGIVVGTSSNTAFRYDSVSDSFVTLGTLGGTISIAYAINDAGQIVGGSTNAAGVNHAFLYEGATMTDLGALGGAANISTARGINNSGMIVGDSNGHGFIYLNGKMIDLNDLIDHSAGITVAYASSINDNGQIVGWGNVPNFMTTAGANNGLLITPVWSDNTTTSPLTVPINTFTVTAGSNAVAGYLVTESATLRPPVIQAGVTPFPPASPLPDTGQGSHMPGPRIQPVAYRKR